MKHWKIVMALLAVCAVIAPALSAPSASDDKQTEKNAQDIVTGEGKSDDQMKCERLTPKPMMMDGRMDRQGIEKPPADDMCDKPGAEKLAPRSMMDGRMNRQGIEKPPADDSDNRPAPKSMMDGRIDKITAVPNKGTVYVVIVQA